MAETGSPKERMTNGPGSDPSRRSTKKRIELWLASRLVYLVVKLLASTYRYRFIGREHRDVAAKLHPNGAFVLALWHEHLFASICGLRGQDFAPLASLSNDGDIVTYVLERLGYPTTRGSSSRGGEEARDVLVEQVATGLRPALTVDGPRGPRRRLKGGVVDIARRSGTAIVPFAAVADRAWVFSKSWDHFQIPKPFATITLCFAAPVVVTSEVRGLAFGECKRRVSDGMAAAESAGKARR